MPRPSRRAELLDAAIAVIRRDGAQRLTLDAVAAEAGVSKGGVLYHFGSNAALIEDPDVLRAARERQAAWMARMLGGALDRTDAWLVRLAADGLWYSDLLEIAPPKGDDRRRLIERLDRKSTRLNS